MTRSDQNEGLPLPPLDFDELEAYRSQRLPKARVEAIERTLAENRAARVQLRVLAKGGPRVTVNVPRHPTLPPRLYAPLLASVTLIVAIVVQPPSRVLVGERGSPGGRIEVLEGAVATALGPTVSNPTMIDLDSTRVRFLVRFDDSLAPASVSVYSAVEGEALVAAGVVTRQAGANFVITADPQAMFPGGHDGRAARVVFLLDASRPEELQSYEDAGHVTGKGAVVLDLILRRF